jgi:hypothetical protein
MDAWQFGRLDRLIESMWQAQAIGLDTVARPGGADQRTVRLADADASRFNRRRYLGSFAKMRDRRKDSIPIMVLDSESRRSGSTN